VIGFGVKTIRFGGGVEEGNFVVGIQYKNGWKRPLFFGLFFDKEKETLMN